ncbi:MAG: agmatinase [Chloroflexi bacterium]|nr:agmatinase [Chloroflexota bacterium]
MSTKPRYRPVDAMVYPRFSGIRTFMRLPLVTDLTDVDFAVVGVPFDTGGTYRVGARFGPEGIRSQSTLLRPFNPALNIAIFDYCSGIDYGDLPVIPGYLPESHQQIEAGASTVYASGATPVFLGGDHSVSLPLLRATAKKFGPVALIHFDSHSDLWPGYFGGKDTHGTPFRRAYEEGLLDTSRSIQVGLRGSVYDEGDVTMPTDLGFEAIPAPEVHEIGMKETIRRIRERVGSGSAYVTFDIDFVDPAYAPATGTPEVGGFTSAQSLQLVRGLIGMNIVGFDVVEVMPPYDPPGSVTCLLAASVAYEFISLIALQRKQI